MQLKGTIIAPSWVEDWKWSNNDRAVWIRFYNVNGLVIKGRGVIDGKGAAWWSCNSNGDCARPTVSTKTHFFGYNQRYLLTL
ncbi:putative polygalacturonase [Lupinus albus]|uniref:Putative polygalacturonase n=1 Tax=Lupinus albus TaxID=3870 RepID=A0A6A4PSU9_LUPAL|nr:putative polygalacturonase [Lupinus albus]